MEEVGDTKVSVRGYLRRKQVAPKTWLVTTVQPYQRRKPRTRPEPVVAERHAAA